MTWNDNNSSNYYTSTQNSQTVHWISNLLGPETFPFSIVKVLVALSEQMDDRLRNVAIEFLAELGSN